jgi:hypothetical protein
MAGVWRSMILPTLALALVIAAVVAHPVRPTHVERLILIYHLAMEHCVIPDDHWCRKAVQKRHELRMLGWKFSVAKLR